MLVERKVLIKSFEHQQVRKPAGLPELENDNSAEWDDRIIPKIQITNRTKVFSRIFLFIKIDAQVHL
jgi:hypothetical protein